MVNVNQQSNFKRSAKLINQINPFIALTSTLIIIAISVFLLSKSFGFNTKQYQRYQNNLIQLQQLDADFNQAVLKSRYELFTSYDPLVYNLQQQRSLQQQLVRIPQFVNPITKKKLNTLLKEVDNALQQKIELSDRFKSRNALLKNSLRYLPLLTNQLESKFDNQAGIENLTTTQVTTLRSNLNKLTRNLLIYNVAIDQKIQSEIENLNNKLAQLEVEYGMTSQDFPTDLVASHTNIILNTKPQVEELTARLVTPITEKTQALGNLTKTSYQQANLTVNIYRLATVLWFLLVLAFLNYLVLKKLRTSNPQFSQYKHKVKRISSTLKESLEVKENLREIAHISNITDLVSCRDALGDLALGVIEVGNQIKQEQTSNHQAESCAFLASQLTLFTKNEQKLFNSKMSLQLKVIFEMILDSKGCQLVEIEELTTQIKLIFAYKSTMKLSQLVSEIKTDSYDYLKQEFSEMTKNMTTANELWSDTYSVTSCDGDFSHNNNGDRTLVKWS